VTGEGLHRVAFYARDAAGNVGDRSAQTATIGIDESSPLVSFVASQDPADPERIEATVSDLLSGADPDRGSIAVRPAGTTQPWEPLPTTVAVGRLVARWNSESSPAGIYEFRAAAYDRAGNRAVSSQRANHTRMVLPNPLKEPVRLEGRLWGAGRAGTVPYGNGAVYRGRLRDAEGAPLAGLPIEVVESFEPGAAWPQRATRVLSAADGSFALRISPGPSRAVTAMFAGTRTLTAAVGDPVRLAVRARTTLRASATAARVGGAPVIFSGRVGRRGVHLPGGGASVELQFKIPGGEWAEFRTVRTDRRGRFRYAYAFSDDDSRGVRFSFRAYVDGGGWPYEPAASRAVSVTGR
jgi:hypothetical protein